MVIVYKIFDGKDKSYSAWYGDIDDIINYLEENYDLKKDESWVDKLEELGLTFKVVYEKEPLDIEPDREIDEDLIPIRCEYCGKVKFKGEICECEDFYNMECVKISLKRLKEGEYGD